MFFAEAARTSSSADRRNSMVNSSYSGVWRTNQPPLWLNRTSLWALVAIKAKSWVANPRSTCCEWSSLRRITSAVPSSFGSALGAEAVPSRTGTSANNRRGRIARRTSGSVFMMSALEIHGKTAPSAAPGQSRDWKSPTVPCRAGGMAIATTTQRTDWVLFSSRRL